MTGVRTLAVPRTESPPSTDIHGVKRDLDKKVLVHIVPFNTKFYGRWDAHSWELCISFHR